MAFESPNYTQIPNDLLGDVCAVGKMSDMGLAELKVTLAVCRITFGFHRNRARASLSEVMTMTGLSRQGVLDGAAQAEKRGTIQRHQTGRKTEWEVITIHNSSQASRPAEEKSASQVVKPVDQTGQVSRPPDQKVVKPVDQTGQASRPRTMKESIKKEKEEKKEKETGAGAPDARAPTAADKLDRLREKFGNDPAEVAMAMNAVQALDENDDRPAGWRDASAAEYAVCQRVADLWTGGKLPWSAKDIEKGIAAAYQLLKLHGDDLRATLWTLDEFHAKEGDSFNVASAYSLRNAIPRFLADREGENGHSWKGGSGPDEEGGVQRTPLTEDAKALRRAKRDDPDRHVREVPILGILQNRRPGGP